VAVLLDLERLRPVVLHRIAESMQRADARITAIRISVKSVKPWRMISWPAANGMR
jgi:hypothetical protein